MLSSSQSLLSLAAALSFAAVVEGNKSFYILFANQIESPQWPTICQNAGIGPQGHECVSATLYKDGAFIISPQNITKDHIAKIKQAGPGSKAIAYFDFHNLPLLPSNKAECPFCQGHIMGDRPGRNCRCACVRAQCAVAVAAPVHYGASALVSSHGLACALTV